MGGQGGGEEGCQGPGERMVSDKPPGRGWEDREGERRDVKVFPTCAEHCCLFLWSSAQEEDDPPFVLAGVLDDLPRGDSGHPIVDSSCGGIGREVRGCR